MQRILSKEKKKDRCETCKYYSCLTTVSTSRGECWYCQKHHCIFCTNHGEKCNDYEFGENDGGRTAESYEEEWDEEDE